MYPLTTHSYIWTDAKYLWKLYSALNSLALWLSFTPQVQTASFSAHSREPRGEQQLPPRAAVSSRSWVCSVCSSLRHEEKLLSARLRAAQCLVSRCTVLYRSRHYRWVGMSSHDGWCSTGSSPPLCSREGVSMELERQILVKSTDLAVNQGSVLGYLLQAMSLLVIPCARACSITKPACHTLWVPRVCSQRAMPRPSRR